MAEPQTICAPLMPMMGPTGTSYFVDTRQGRFPVEFINGEPFITPKGYAAPIKVLPPPESSTQDHANYSLLESTTSIRSIRGVNDGDYTRMAHVPTMPYQPVVAPPLPSNLESQLAAIFKQYESNQRETQTLRYKMDQMELVLQKVSLQLSQLQYQVGLIPIHRTSTAIETDDIPSPTSSMVFHESVVTQTAGLIASSTTPLQPSSSLTTRTITSKPLPDILSYRLPFDKTTVAETIYKRPTIPNEPSPPTTMDASPSAESTSSFTEVTQNMTQDDVEAWLTKHNFSINQGGLKDAVMPDGGMRPIHLACHHGHIAVVDFLLTHGFATIADRTTTQLFTPLLRACRSGQLPMVRYLLSKGARVDEKDSYGDTALLSAAMFNQLPVVQYLLTHGSSLKERSTGLHSAVIRAAMNGHLSTVRWLLANGASAQEQDKDGYTPLLCAALHGHVDLVKFLLTPPAYSSLTETSRSGNTAFLCAARDGHLEIIQFLVTLDPKLRNHADCRGTTVMMRAAANGHLALVDWILDLYPDAVHDKDYEQDNALTFAAMAGHTRVVHYLLHPPKGTHGVDINARNKLGYTPLIRAAMNGRKEVASLLLKEGADLWLADKDGFTAALCAALHGYLPVLELIVSEAKQRHGVEEAVNKLRDGKTITGRTLIMCAARNGHLKITEYVIANQLGNVDDRDKEDDTALICAAMNDHVEVVQWLIEHGVSAIQSNKDGHTALIRAAMNGRLRIVQWLLEDGQSLMKAHERPKIADTDRDGYSATICAALHGHLTLLKYLVETQHATLTETTRSGQTALLCAARNGKLEVVKWLIEKGANHHVKDLSGNTVMDCAKRSNCLPLISFLDNLLASSTASSNATVRRLTITDSSTTASGFS